MGIYHGKTGVITFAGAHTDLQSWTLNTTSDIADTTSMTDSWESHEIGLIDFTATAERLAQTELDFTTYLGVGGSLVLSCSASHYFTGTAICTGLTESVTIDDVGKMSLAFEGNDADGLAFT